MYNITTRLLIPVIPSMIAIDSDDYYDYFDSLVYGYPIILFILPMMHFHMSLVHCKVMFLLWSKYNQQCFYFGFRAFKRFIP